MIKYVLKIIAEEAAKEGRKRGRKVHAEKEAAYSKTASEAVPAPTGGVQRFAQGIIPIIPDWASNGKTVGDWTMPVSIGNLPPGMAMLIADARQDAVQ